MEVSLAIAFAAGLVSFASPCVLALVPVYLAFLGQAASVAPPLPNGHGRLAVTVGGSLAGRTVGQPVVVDAILFVAGFSAVFVAVGVSFGLLGAVLFTHEPVRQAAGIVVIGIGLLSTGIVGPVLERFRMPVPADRLPAGGRLRSVALGALVGVGWTPCIGPVLGAILTMGASTQQAPIAAVLLTAYSAGLAVPFLAAAFGLRQLTPLVGLLRRRHAVVRLAAGLLIIGIGVLIYLNAFSVLAGLFVPWL